MKHRGLRKATKPGNRPSSLKRSVAEKHSASAKRPTPAKSRGSHDEQLRVMFEDNPHPMWVFDLNALRFLAVNKAAVEAYGYSKAEFLSMTVKDIRPVADVPKMVATIRDSKSEFLHHGIWTHHRKDGTAFSAEITCHKIKFNGHDAGLTMAVDASGLQKAEEERSHLLAREEAALTEAQAASLAKDEFLALISHELRTPMTAMLGWMWLLRSKALDDEGRQRAVDIIERNMHLQAQIIEDILDVSNIVTGKLHLQTHLVQLKPIVEAAVKVVRPAAEAKSIKIETRLDESVGLVLGDPDRLQQVFWNLLSNSIKFTPENGQLHIRLRRDGSNAEVAVQDTGQGIHPEFVPFLFNRFRQGENSITRKHRGLGLGLALVRDLVELHGGTVRAASEGLGRGATFTIRLPTSAGTPADKTPEKEAPPAAGRRKLPMLEGIRVLLVEDEADARELFCAMLGRCGAKVIAVGSVPEAMENFRREPPSVVVTDIAMPGEDGYALIRKIRALRPEQGGDTPAAALTACVQTEDRAQVLQAGFQIYIPKPVDPIDLASAIRQLASRKSNS